MPSCCTIDRSVRLVAPIVLAGPGFRLRARAVLPLASCPVMYTFSGSSTSPRPAGGHTTMLETRDLSFAKPGKGIGREESSPGHGNNRRTEKSTGAGNGSRRAHIAGTGALHGLSFSETGGFSHSEPCANRGHWPWHDSSFVICSNAIEGHHAGFPRTQRHSRIFGILRSIAERECDRLKDGTHLYRTRTRGPPPLWERKERKDG